jgi:hypothetical protein
MYPSLQIPGGLRPASKPGPALSLLTARNPRAASPTSKRRTPSVLPDLSAFLSRRGFQPGHEKGTTHRPLTLPLRDATA